MADFHTIIAQNDPKPQPALDQDDHDQTVQIDRDLSDRIGLTVSIARAYAENKTPAQVLDELADKLSFLPPEQRADFIENVGESLARQIQLNTRRPPPITTTSKTPSASADDQAPASTPNPNPGRERISVPGQDAAHDQQLPLFDGNTQPDPDITAPGRLPGHSNTDTAAAPPQPPDPATRRSPADQIAAFGPAPLPVSADAGAGQSATNEKSPDVSKAPALATQEIAASADNAADRPAAAPAAQKEKPYVPAPNVAISGAGAVLGQLLAKKDGAKDKGGNITFAGPSAAFGQLLSRFRTEPDEEATQVTAAASQPATVDVVAQSRMFERNRMDPRRHDASLAAAQDAGKNTLQSLKAIEDSKDLAIVLNRINAAAKQVGIANVIDEMRPGGKYEDLRKEFNVAINENSTFKGNQEDAHSALDTYAEKRAEITEILKSRPEALKTFDDLDADIIKRFARLPAAEDGKSLLDQTAENVKDFFTKAIDLVRGGFGKAPDQNAAARLAPSPGP